MEPIQSSKVRKSLLTYMTTFGVDDWLFILNLEVALMMTLLLKVRAWPLVALALHLALMLVTKLAPNLLECYVQHLRQASRYWPRPSPLQRRNLRPEGFGRGDFT